MTVRWAERVRVRMCRVISIVCAALRSLSPITTGQCNEIQSRVWRWALEQGYNRLQVCGLISADELLTLLQHFPRRRCHSPTITTTTAAAASQK